ncbi:MAG: putative toxin-antitoxin system toxin component, PIN family [Chitinivibrionia bacterium]|nr:putative toxin-antitoxin system toxin component, PIN family [Chitinivibrionia bacterium]
MKLVLDTNVFVSAFYWGGNPQIIINRIVEGIDTLYISNEIINELFDVMSRPKFKTAPDVIERYACSLENLGRKVFIAGKIKGICRDKDDDDKIECGITSGANYLITGDNDLLVLKEYRGLKIITVKDYMEEVNKKFMF